MHDRCYATLCIQSDSPGQQGRTWGTTEPHMFRLFAALLLNFTRLPLYVLHNEGVHPLTILSNALPLRSLYGPRPQVHAFTVDVIKSKVRSPISQRHYESMYTKFHAWRLPCKRVALVDYDVLTLRSPDAIFAECGDAEFCAVRAQGGDFVEFERYFNGGVFVLRPDNATYHGFRDALESDAEHAVARSYAEQDLLNHQYPNWKELPPRYNVQNVGAGMPWNEHTDVWIHEKYWVVPEAVRARLHVPKSLPEPSWLDHVRQFFGHLW